MATPNRGLPELSGNVAPDVPYHVNTALRAVDAEIQTVDTESITRDEEQKLRLAQLETAAGFPNNPVAITDQLASTVINNKTSASSAAVRKIVEEQAFPYSDLDIFRARMGKRDTSLVNVVLVGSSTIAGHGVAVDQSIGYQLSSMIHSAYPKANGVQHYKPVGLTTAAASTATQPGIRICNGANGGSNAANYLNATGINLIKGLNPAAIIHMVGSNDYASKKSVAQYKTEVTAMLDQFASLGDTLHVLCHAYERQDVTSPAAPWSAYGKALKEIAELRTNVLFVDLSRPFAEMGLPANDPFDLISGDLIHATEAGHNIMAASLRDALMLVPQSVDTGWLTPTFQTGYTHRDAGRALAYRVKDGVIYFRGGVAKTDATNFGTTLQNVAYISTVGLNPIQPTTGIGISGTNTFSMRYAEIGAAARTNLFIFPGTATTYVMFSDKSYALELLDS